MKSKVHLSKEFKSMLTMLEQEYELCRVSSDVLAMAEAQACFVLKSKVELSGKELF